MIGQATITAINAPRPRRVGAVAWSCDGDGAICAGNPPCGAVPYTIGGAVGAGGSVGTCPGGAFTAAASQRGCDALPIMCWSAAMTSSALLGRASGGFASRAITSPSTSGGTQLASAVGRGGAMSRCAPMISPAPSPTNGGRPHSISNRMQPSE